MGHPLYLVIILVLSVVGQSFSDREHRIHNIVLYPEKESWCKTEPIKQVVAMPGYAPVTIDNNVCVGACYSYSIPKTQPAEPGELIGPYCDSCQPVDTKCYHVTLQADATNPGPSTIQKRVQIIVKCSCMSCDKIENKDCDVLENGTSELPSDLFADLNLTSAKAQPPYTPDVPDLFGFHPHHNRSAISTDLWKTSPPKNYELNAGLIQLLKSIQSEDEEGDESSNFSYNKEQLNELLEIIEGSEHQLNDKNLMDFVNFVNVHNSEDLELDLSRLKEVLTAFRRDQEIMESHRSFGLGPIKTSEQPLRIDILEQSIKNNQDINRDIENLSQKYNLPKNYGLEGSHLGLGSYKGSHIGMGIKHNNLVTGKSKPDVASTGKSTGDITGKSIVETLSMGKPKVEASTAKVESVSGENLVVEATNTAKIPHHIGDEVHMHGETGHLQKGPHGSLTFVPDVKVKLHLDNQVKPYHDEAIFAYENEPKK